MLLTTQTTKHISRTLFFLALIAILGASKLYPAELVKMQDLDFGVIERGVPALHVINPLDVNAAVFSYTGVGANNKIRLEVTNLSGGFGFPWSLQNPSLTNFTFAYNGIEAQQSGSNWFSYTNGFGNIDDLRVGVTASVPEGILYFNQQIELKVTEFHDASNPSGSTEPPATFDDTFDLRDSTVTTIIFDVVANLFTPVTLQVNEHMNFPIVETSPVSQDIVLDPNIGASIEITGDAYENVMITLPNSENLTSVDTAMTINIVNFVLQSGGMNLIGGLGTLSSTGSLNVDIGATAEIPADLDEGNYSGTATITVIYQ